MGSPSRPGFGLPSLLTSFMAPEFSVANAKPISQPQLTGRKHLDQQPAGKDAQALTALMTGQQCCRAHSAGPVRDTAGHRDKELRVSVSTPGTSASPPTHALRLGAAG